MRFHHSTRRGRNRFGQLGCHHPGQSHLRLAHRYPTSTSLWSHLGYCRQTNIHFNRRLPVEPPSSAIQAGGESHFEEVMRVEEESSSNCLELRNHDQQVALDEKKSKHHNKMDQISHQLARLSITSAGEDGSTSGSPSKAKRRNDMEKIREQLVAHVEKHPFWSNKAAKRMQLTSVHQRHIYFYELTSFCERRDLEWRYEPYKGSPTRASLPFRKYSYSGQYATPTSSPVGWKSSTFVPVPTASDDPMLSDEPETETPKLEIQATSCSNSNKPAVYRPLCGIERRTMPSPDIVWSVEVPVRFRPAPFNGFVYTCQMPDSSFVKVCHGCDGRGRLKCASCYGVGYEVCLSCSGKGSTRGVSAGASSSGRSDYARAAARNSTSANGDDDDHSGGLHSRRKYDEPGGITSSALPNSSWASESCHVCHGAGQKRCWICASKGYNFCPACSGAGHLRCYLNLNITWLNHRDESILNNSDNIIPKERLKLSRGRMLVDQIGDQLTPLDSQLLTKDGATLERINDSNQLFITSKRLLDKHKQAYHQERLIKQRQQVTKVHCQIVNYEWKQKRGHFVIYGEEQKVYIAKYPFKTICNIT